MARGHARRASQAIERDGALRRAEPGAAKADDGPDRQRAARQEGPRSAVEGLDPFDAGLIVGVLVGEGHFGGDGRQPQITLRMHTDHEALFAWLVRSVPGSRLYGPYEHGGRRYYQWMARGTCLRDVLLPLLERHLRPEHSGRVWARYSAMRERYELGSTTGP